MSGEGPADQYHNGAFMLDGNSGFYASFTPRVGGPQLPAHEPRFDAGTPDAYEFFLSLPPLAEVNERLFGGRAGYWQEIVDHPERVLTNLTGVETREEHHACALDAEAESP